MQVNPKIRELFKEISIRAIELSNSKDENRVYLRRLLSIYKNDLTDNEQIYILNQFLKEISFKEAGNDIEKIHAIYAIRTKFAFQLIVGVVGLIFVAGIVFRTNPYINSIVDGIGKSFMLFGVD